MITDGATREQMPNYKGCTSLIFTEKMPSFKHI